MGWEVVGWFVSAEYKLQTTVRTPRGWWWWLGGGGCTQNTCFKALPLRKGEEGGIVYTDYKLQGTAELQRGGWWWWLGEGYVLRLHVSKRCPCTKRGGW